MSKQGYIFIFTGDVQGVGFRFFLSRLAHERGVKGYAKNEIDGTVLALIDCDEEEAKAFLQDVIHQAPGTIDHYVQKKVHLTTDYTNFQVY